MRWHFICFPMDIFDNSHSSSFLVKKLNKQLDKLQLQLAESRSLSRDLKVQLTEACDYKIIIKSSNN
ncbi:uncharacterized protein LOC142327793 isoform X1 [Lycorma delicatula]|uniref:uncharacterized protein LOC142327793 isoform X1 n=1 Tax=Lycorma delicatula TaxID=130591 RepID=UPI003F50DFAD